MKIKKINITLSFLLFLALWSSIFLAGFNWHAQAGVLYLPSLPDKGVYHYFLNGDLVRTCDFTWKVDGSYQSDTTFRVTSGRPFSLSVSMEVDEAKQWVGFQLKSSEGSMKITQEGNMAVIDDGKIRKITLKSASIPYVMGNPALISLVLQAYDEVKGGLQIFSHLRIGINELFDSGIERLDQSIWTVKGQHLKLTCYLMDDPDGVSYIYVDEKGRVILWNMPSEDSAYIRQGYEELFKLLNVNTRDSTPSYEIVVDKNVRIPMRDGINLATDIYRPKMEGKWPVILTRTPYMKEMNKQQAHFYARHGYVVAMQDCRGRFSSGGTWEPFVHEAHDGYDTIEWLAGQSWSTSKIGMIGTSYDGYVQWMAARERPPHLITIIPNCATSDPYFSFPYINGCFLSNSLGWVYMLESKAEADFSNRDMLVSNYKKLELLKNREIPLIDQDKQFLGEKNKYWRTWIDHPNYDSYWASIGFLDRLAEIHIPVFHQSGWFDKYTIGTKLNYLKMKSFDHANQKLVLGPWGHYDQATRRLQEHDFGKEAWVDLRHEYLRWFDFWLKGIKNGVDQEPLISIYIMGANEWLKSDRYPLPQTQMTKLYLAASEDKESSENEGLLTFEPHKKNTPAGHYTYDPVWPTFSPVLFGAHAETERKDIMAYQTAPLKASLTFAGPISAVLYAATSAKDTDWFVSLFEDDPAGATTLLARGMIRARYRDSFKKPKLLKPGEVYRYELDLSHTAIRIPVNGRLRVEISSASFPNLSCNLNTGGHNETETKYVKAEQTIYQDAAHPSYILLPVIEFKKKEK